MAKKKRNRPKTKSIPLTAILPGALVIGRTVWGGGDLVGAWPVTRDKGIVDGLREGGKLLVMQTTGIDIDGGPYRADLVGQTAGAAIGGGIAHKVAQKTGTNRGLRMIQHDLAGLKTVVVIQTPSRDWAEDAVDLLRRHRHRLQKVLANRMPRDDQLDAEAQAFIDEYEAEAEAGDP